jgi:hypothetical protein
MVLREARCKMLWAAEGAERLVFVMGPVLRLCLP